MIRIVFLLALFMSTCLQAQDRFNTGSDSLVQSRQVTDQWFSRDKGQHLLGSFMMVGISSLSLNRMSDYNTKKSIFIGASVTISLGVLKEVYDGSQDDNIFSLKDMTANLLGIAAGIIIFR